MVGPELRSRCLGPTRCFQQTESGSKGGRGNLGSGILSFPDIIGRDISLLPVNFSQPPLCIACDIFKLKDLESLIGRHTQFIWVSCLEGVDGKIDLVAFGLTASEPSVPVFRSRIGSCAPVFWSWVGSCVPIF